MGTLFLSFVVVNLACVVFGVHSVLPGNDCVSGSQGSFSRTNWRGHCVPAADLMCTLNKSEVFYRS